MGRKTAKVALGDLAAKVDGRLPPVLAGPPSWAPVGYVCTPADVVEVLVPGHRRVTAKDRAAFAAAWNATPQPSHPAPVPAAPRPPQPTSPHEPIPLPPIDHMEQEFRRKEQQLREAWQRDTKPDDPSDETRRQTVARG